MFALRNRCFNEGLLNCVRLVTSNVAARSINKVAMVLSGCGVYDGTEVHEASAMMVYLSRAEAKVECFAPDTKQAHVINHMTGEPDEIGQRNVMEESARITRGPVLPLEKLNSKDFNAVVFPGGFGAAKNLCTFAFDGKDCTVLPEVERIIKEFHSNKKPIGMCCVAPILAAAVLKNVTLTVGWDSNEDGRWPHAGVAQAVQAMGARHVNTTSFGLCIDEANRLVSTPAFMCDTQIHKIHDGIGNLVNSIVRMIANK